MLTKLDAFASKEEVFQALKELKREGPLYIKEGQHISKEQFLETFGFRDCQFDLGIDEEKQQLDIDLAYVAFLDLAYVLEIDPKDISLGNRLSICYKMLVGRATDNTAALYNSKTNTIEIGRICGRGCLAHEWAHSLDYNLSGAFALPEKRSIVERIELPRGLKKEEILTPEIISELINQMKYRESNSDNTLTAKFNSALCGTDVGPINEWCLQMDRLFHSHDIGYGVRRVYTEKIICLWAELHRLLDWHKPACMNDEESKEWERLYRGVFTRRNQLIGGEYIRPNNYGTYEPLEKLEAFCKQVDKYALSIDKVGIVWTLGKLNNFTGIESDTSFLSNSKLADMRKTGEMTPETPIRGQWFGYYGRNDELLARAFEVYVGSRLKMMNMCSEYLCDVKTETKRLAYPKGKEAREINYKLDELLAQLKELGILHEFKRDEFKKFEVQSD